MPIGYYWANRPTKIKYKNPLGATFERDINVDTSPVVHVATFTDEANPNGTKGRFTWAQDPDAVVAFCEAHPHDIVIVDDCERRYSGEDFCDTVRGVYWARDMIGKEFV